MFSRHIRQVRHWYIQYVPLYEMSSLLGSSGSTILLWKVSAAVPHSVLTQHWAKGGNGPVTSDFLGIFLVLTIFISHCIQNHEIVNFVTFLAFSRVYEALLCKNLLKKHGKSQH